MKRIKMVLYGEPGVGKSVFASKSPKPFFICTDGNYEWLEEFGADPNAHVNVMSWSEAKKIFNKLQSAEYEKYETIVVDLTEDLFKWCEQEYCVRNNIEHLSDLGYGKAYDTTRNEFFIEICKLINLDKNIIFIMHGITFTVKDRRGIEHTKYAPTSRIPDKVLDMIEGRVRYFIRCYLKDEEQDDGTLIKQRMLSFVPKPNEFGIIRGINENNVPHDIPLKWKEFERVIGFDKNLKEETDEVAIKEEAQPVRRRRKKEVVEEPEQLTIEVAEEVSIEATTAECSDNTTVEDDCSADEINEEVEKTVKETSSVDDRIAAIKAKLAALAKNKEN